MRLNFPSRFFLLLWSSLDIWSVFRFESGHFSFFVSAFPSVGQFCALLGLAPNNQLSGSGQKRRTSQRPTNRLGQALRQGAVTMRSSTLELRGETSAISRADGKS
ncbi:MAG: transposase [Gammaproteobacteria bacterium]|nr:transposase [Gammaproteobacteria bacterium]MYF52976.1 transposase [Gammaproteobacteria bacterium]MYK43736.1 transposase [Gammaproteobacteria bacterium]